MPHIVIKGNISLNELWGAFVSLREELEGRLIKIEEIYLEQKGFKALFPTIVVEEGHTQRYYIIVGISGSKNQFTIRIDPLSDPIKTKAVKRSLALLAEMILHRFENLTMDHHNIAG